MYIVFFINLLICSFFSVAASQTPIMQSTPPPPQMYSPQQFISVPPPSSISNMPGYTNNTGFMQQQSAYTYQTTPYDPTSLSYPPTPYGQQQMPLQPTPFSPQTYTSFPQVQSGAVTTPISLPGMPPITVSTTIPPQQLEGIQFNPMTSHQN